MEGAQGLLMFILRIQFYLDIHAKVEKIFFDNDSCNFFVEDECVTSINEITRQQLDGNECLWEYLKRKGIILWRTTLVLRSCIETLFHLSRNKANIEDLDYQFSSNDLLDKKISPVHFQNSVQMFCMEVESAFHQSESNVVHEAPLRLKMSA